MAPIVRAGEDGERELVMARWGMLGPLQYGGAPTTNIRNVSSPDGRRCGPKSAPLEGMHELFGFLTTDANAIVAPIHPKAMPVILTTAAEVDQWLTRATAWILNRAAPRAFFSLQTRARSSNARRAAASS
jgi:putative SOS response-associated peptidase YedK